MCSWACCLALTAVAAAPAGATAPPSEEALLLQCWEPRHPAGFYPAGNGQWGSMKTAALLEGSAEELPGPSHNPLDKAPTQYVSKIYRAGPSVQARPIAHPIFQPAPNQVPRQWQSE